MTVALFHWAVNFGVEQVCVWEQPLEVVWPVHADSPCMRSRLPGPDGREDG